MSQMYNKDGTRAGNSKCDQSHCKDDQLTEGIKRTVLEFLVWEDDGATNHDGNTQRGTWDNKSFILVSEYLLQYQYLVKMSIFI